jgi:two-component system, cell cycle sensor histidine kinase PleC
LKALAESLKGPAYRRLLAAERTLRRGIPILVVAFIAMLIFGGVVQILELRREAIAEASHANVVISSLIADSLTHTQASESAQARASEELRRADSIGLIADSQTVLIADQDSTIIAASPQGLKVIGGKLGEFPAAPQSIINETSRADVRLKDGNEVLVAERALASPLGQVVTYQSLSSVLSEWERSSALTTTLTITTSFIVLILGFAFHWQSSRAREGDLISERVRDRIDVALTSGRCGGIGT